MKVKLKNKVKFADWYNEIRVGEVLKIEFDLLRYLYWIECEGYAYVVNKRRILEIIN